jgi:hypothetical protein
MVTLRKFLEIAPDVVLPWICVVYLEYEHEYWGTDTKILFNSFENINKLDDYLDCEIVSFHQEYSFGELDAQYITLREVK